MKEKVTMGFAARLALFLLVVFTSYGAYWGQGWSQAGCMLTLLICAWAMGREFSREREQHAWDIMETNRKTITLAYEILESMEFSQHPRRKELQERLKWQYGWKKCFYCRQSLEKNKSESTRRTCSNCRTVYTAGEKHTCPK